MVFLRYPEPGRVKSRLAADIGQQKATDLYARLVRRTLGVVGDFQRTRSRLRVLLFYTPPEREEAVKQGYPGRWRFVAQAGCGLGERMAHAFRHVLDRGARHAVLIGTDIADLQISDLDEAFQALEEGQAVLGPAADGGYYLIGLNRPCEAVFQSQAWGSENVFERTRATLGAGGFRVKILKQRTDVDREADLCHPGLRDLVRHRVSVVIPTLQSVDDLQPFLAALEAQLWPEDEIILVQGREHPQDDQATLGSRVRMLRSQQGRGLQLNRGAHAARGDLFWFLHSDCHPPVNFGYHVRKLTSVPQMALGCFQLAFHPTQPALQGITRWVDMRTRYFGLPYGDQGLFCQRESFEKVGGFRKAFLMEDVDFVRSMRSLGKILVIPEKIIASPERYVKGGIIKNSLRNHLLLLLYRLGVDDRTLYSLYYRGQ
jgi:rSAM/selenodomain-associated transferase 1/rSAM/selenodomain-associated transferase 2